MQITLDKDIKQELITEVRKAYSEAIEQARRDVGLIKEFYRYKECLEVLNIGSLTTFKANYIDQGLPTYKIGNSVYVKKTELNNFIEQHQI